LAFGPSFPVPSEFLNVSTLRLLALALGAYRRTWPFGLVLTIGLAASTAFWQRGRTDLFTVLSFFASPAFCRPNFFFGGRHVDFFERSFSLGMLSAVRFFPRSPRTVVRNTFVLRLVSPDLPHG